MVTFITIHFLRFILTNNRTYNLTYKLVVPAMVSFSLLLCPVISNAGESMMLSDRIIEGITGRSGVSTTFIEIPSAVDIPDMDLTRTYSFWGDTDGIPGLNCPGYTVVEFPYKNFQWQYFRYSFADEESAETFKAALTNSTTAIPTSTTLIKTPPSADSIFLNDGTPPRITEVIVTTDRQVIPRFVTNYGGTLIEEKVNFQLTFTAEEHYRTERLYQKTADPVYNRPRRASTYSYTGIAVDDIYELRTKIYGAVLMESGKTGGTPETFGSVTVPENTTYIINTLSSGLRLYSPRLGAAIGLAPPGTPFHPQHLALEGQAHFPDLSHYQTMGYLDITGLDVKLGGGYPIYLFYNQ